jgi:type I restriction enzyme S subunit
LGDHVTIRGGGTPRRDVERYFLGNIPWITPKDMKAWELYDSELRITNEALHNSAATLLPKDTVLLVVRSGVLKHTVPVAINRVPVAINQDMKSLECGSALDPNYLARLLKAAEPTILTWVRATTADNFSIDNIREMQFTLPSLDEQRRIAAILDQADDLRRKRGVALEKLNALPQAIFQEMFGDPIHNSGKWPLTTLSDVVTGFDTGKNVVAEDALNPAARYRVLKISSIGAGGYDGNQSKALPDGYVPPSGHLVRTGDLLITRANTRELVGRVAFVEQTPDHVYLPDKILRFLLSIKIALPPVRLQRSFSAAYEHTSALTRSHRAHLRRLDQLFASLQHRALSGTLTPLSPEAMLTSV